MKPHHLFIAVLLLVPLAPRAFGQLKPAQSSLPNFDKRKAGDKAMLAEDKAAAVVSLHARIAGVKVDFDYITGSPKMISAATGFLSGPNGKGKGISAEAADAFAVDDPHRAVKAFLKEHRSLFGHGPEVLTSAQVKREFVTEHNGMKTIVWEQQLDGIPVFEALL